MITKQKRVMSHDIPWILGELTNYSLPKIELEIHLHHLCRLKLIS